MLSGAQTGLLYSTPLLGGDTGTEQTIRMLRSLVDDAWRNGQVNQFAVHIVRSAGVPQYDAWGQVRAIYNWVHQNFYFVNDPVTKEALRPTADMLQKQNRYGDCDDINANVLPALLGAIGYDVRLVTIAVDPSQPDAFTHVYCEVFIDGAWYPLDAARPDASFGVAPPQYYRREWWSLTDSSHGDYDAGLGSTLNPARKRFAGLGSVTSDITAILSDASSGLRSVNGQLVQPAVGSVIGPGGATYMTPAPIAPMSANTELLLLAIAGLVIWAVL